ncbi:uncharacterized protein LOC134533876 [Bacillus rossius redtenbacheri]|uniref:uncharacterized protein LOC134533876 n=1 Tax=Bacillus rossius redtenbacheri TaxID=93214 RepID=UPI002FDCFAB0
MKVWWFSLALVNVLGGCAENNGSFLGEEARSVLEGSRCSSVQDWGCGPVLVCRAGTCHCRNCTDLETMQPYWRVCRACLNVRRTYNYSFGSRDKFWPCYVGQHCECVTKCSVQMQIMKSEITGTKIVLTAAAAVAMLAAVTLFWHSYYRNTRCTRRDDSVTDQSQLAHGADARHSISFIQQHVLTRLRSPPPSYDDTCHIRLERPPPYDVATTGAVETTMPAVPQPSEVVCGTENLSFNPDGVATATTTTQSVVHIS